MTDPRPFGAYAPTGFAHGLSADPRPRPDWATRRLALMPAPRRDPVPGGAPVDIEALGARMRLYPYNNVCEKKACSRRNSSTPRSSTLLKDRGSRNGFTFVDVGLECRRLCPVRRRSGRAARPHPGGRASARGLRPTDLQHPRRTRSEPSRRSPALSPTRPGSSLSSSTPITAANRASRSSGRAMPATVRVPSVTLLDLLQAEGFTTVDADQARRRGRRGPDPRPLLPRRARIPLSVPVPDRGRARSMADRPAQPAGIATATGSRARPG